MAVRGSASSVCLTLPLVPSGLPAEDRVDVDPLVVTGGVGELADPVLADGEPVGDAKLLADELVYGVQGVTRYRHAVSSRRYGHAGPWLVHHSWRGRVSRTAPVVGRDDLGGECVVELDQVDVVYRHAGLVQGDLMPGTRSRTVSSRSGRSTTVCICSGSPEQVAAWRLIGRSGEVVTFPCHEECGDEGGEFGRAFEEEQVSAAADDLQLGIGDDPGEAGHPARPPVPRGSAGAGRVHGEGLHTM
jgi:hypothetical protein